MGIWDKAKQMAGTAKDMAVDAANKKYEEVKTAQIVKAEAKEAQKAAQEELASIFTLTKSYGRIEVDQSNEIIKVIGPVEELPKEESGLVKGARVFGAIYTLGASLAVESAMKNKPLFIPFSMVRGYSIIRDDEETVGDGTFEAKTSSWGIGVASGSVGVGLGSGRTRGYVSDRQVKKSVSLLALRLDLKSFEMPCVFVPYITDNTSTKSTAYKRALTDMHVACSALDIISSL